MLFKGNFSFVVASKEEPVILYDGLEIRSLSFGIDWVPVGYSLGWNPGKAPEVLSDAGANWANVGRGLGGEAVHPKAGDINTKGSSYDVNPFKARYFILALILLVKPVVTGTGRS